MGKLCYLEPIAMEIINYLIFILRIKFENCKTSYALKFFFYFLFGLSSGKTAHICSFSPSFSFSFCFIFLYS